MDEAVEADILNLGLRSDDIDAIDRLLKKRVALENFRVGINTNYYADLYKRFGIEVDRSRRQVL